MLQRLVRTPRYVARFLTQHTARTNAAEGSASLRERRQEQEDVDEYLRVRGDGT